MSSYLLPTLDAKRLKANVDLVAFAGQFTHPERQIFYCFGCQRGGDVFSLVMALQGCSFPDAVREVASFASGFVSEGAKC